jgi:hypothetical protein
LPTASLVIEAAIGVDVEPETDDGLAGVDAALAHFDNEDDVE